MPGWPLEHHAQVMHAIHDAFRRELNHIAQIAARADEDPRRILRTAVGWKMFETFLRVHHNSEDEALWPAMRQVLADRPVDLGVLDAMEAEHAALDRLLAAVDAELSDGDSEPSRLAGLVDDLASVLTGHLEHEESDALPLIAATVTEPQWRHFGAVHRKKIGADASLFLPWLLDGASDDSTTIILESLGEPARATYQNQWRTAYAGLDRWGTTTVPTQPSEDRP